MFQHVQADLPLAELAAPFADSAAPLRERRSAFGAAADVASTSARIWGSRRALPDVASTSARVWGSRAWSRAAHVRLGCFARPPVRRDVSRTYVEGVGQAFRASVEAAGTAVACAGRGLRPRPRRDSEHRDRPFNERDRLRFRAPDLRHFPDSWLCNQVSFL